MSFICNIWNYFKGQINNILVIVCACHVGIRKATTTANLFELARLFHSGKTAFPHKNKFIFGVIRKKEASITILVSWQEGLRLKGHPSPPKPGKGRFAFCNGRVGLPAALMNAGVQDISWWRSEIKFLQGSFVFVFKQRVTVLQSSLNTSTRETLQTGMHLVNHSLDWFGKGLVRIWKIPELVWCQEVRNTLCWGQKGDFEPPGLVSYPTKAQIFYSRQYLGL